jgi:AraC-like DNA-binding protein
VGSDVSSRGYDRVVERRRAVALARHYRDVEGLSVAQIARCLGRSPATVKAYFYDPTGEKARAVKARYVGVCRGCGAYTQPRNGKGDAYAYCKACHPGAIQRRWTRERVLEAIGEWLDRYGSLPSSYDWSRTHARRRGGEALRRLEADEWPPASVVTSAFGSWDAAREAASGGAVTTPELGERGVDGSGAVGREPEPDVDCERGGARCADEAINLGARVTAGSGAGV